MKKDKKLESLLVDYVEEFQKSLKKELGQKNPRDKIEKEGEDE